jgi:hypothetical protein
VPSKLVVMSSIVPGGRGCGCGELVLGNWDGLTIDSLRLLAPARRQTTCSEVEAAEVGKVVGVSSLVLGWIGAARRHPQRSASCLRLASIETL